MEALGPVVPTTGLGGVNQREGRRDTIRRGPLLVKVDSDSRYVRGPTGVDEQGRVVERPR